MAINVFVDISYVLFSSCMFKADFIFLLILTCKEAFIERFLVQGFELHNVNMILFALSDAWRTHLDLWTVFVAVF